MVGMTGFEPATSCSQSTRATNCATSRYIKLCGELLLPLFYKCYRAPRGRPPPSHRRYSSLGTLAPLASCFGRFRCAKNRRLEDFCLATTNCATSRYIKLCGELLLPLFYKCYRAPRGRPPPSHRRYSSLGTLAPLASCFGRFRCAKNRRLEDFCLATTNCATSRNR